MRARVNQAVVIASGTVHQYVYAMRRPGFPVAMRTVVTILDHGHLEYETTHMDSGVMLDPALPTVIAFMTAAERAKAVDA